ncbi:MAG: hypothetical protein JO255_07330 [Alphaproteobacteria bacterium]|nr:hypothetical protein [Alphaproteobacteria bacterium]
MRLEQIGTFGPEFDELFERIAVGYTTICVRDRQYLSWRYLDAPGRYQTPFAIWRDGELVGFVVAEIAANRVSVIDLFCAEDPDLIDDAMQGVINQAAAQRCSLLEIWCLSDGLLPARLRALGFVKTFVVGFQVALSDRDVQRDVLLSPAAWHFTTGDTEQEVSIWS